MTTTAKTTPAKKTTKKTPTPSKPSVSKTAEATVEVNTETAAKVVETTAEVAKQGVDKAAASSKEQLETVAKVSAETFKGYEDMVSLSKDNIEAFVKSNEIVAKGVQEINETILQLVQNNVSQGVDYTQKIMSCTSVEEVIALQQEIAVANYSKSVEESRLLSDMTIKLAETASKPISDRVNVTIETLSKPIAA